MSDSLLKKATLDRLAAHLATYLATVPDGAPLAGRIFTEAAQQGDDAKFPSLRIVPTGRFRFDRQQDTVVEQVDRGTHLVVVGEIVGPIALRVSGNTSSVRERLEQVVRAAFFQEEEVQGRIIDTLPPLTLGGVVTTYPAPICFDLDSDEWDDEKVFAERLYSDLTLEATLPLLVTRAGTQIDELVLVVATTVLADLNDDTIPTDEIQVLPDGTTDLY